jgi:predicted membrane protein
MTDEPPPLHDDRPSVHKERVVSGRLLAGFIIIGIGILFLASNLGFISARHVIRALWPLVFVAVGVVMLNRPERRHGREWGWVFIAVGVWMFADRIGWIGIGIGEILIPALLLFAGAMLVKRALSDGKQKEPLGPANGLDDHAEFVSTFACMSSTELRPVSRPFRGADLSAVMAGIKLDLSGASMEGDSATVEVFSFAAGIEIFVPPDWTVSSKVTTVIGGYIDKRRPTSVVPTKTLTITGTVMLSGIEVKN